MTLKYDHLEGMEFDIGTQNCYTILRSFYKDNYDIELTDYAGPTDWWSGGLELYQRLASSEGFNPVHCHPQDWKPGDVFLMALGGSSTGNHIGILLDNGKILHHLYGQRSLVTSYGGAFRNATVGVYRHEQLKDRETEEKLLDIRDVLPLHVKRRIEELEAAGDQPSAED